MIRAAAALRVEARTTFSSLSSRNFKLWFIGQGISHTGFWVQQVALALLVLHLGGSGTVLGVVVALQFLPVLFVGLWAGAVSDRVDKRRLLMATQAVMMATALVLGALVIGGVASLWSIAVLAAITGIAFAFDQPARRTIVTELVDDEHGANAVSLNGALGSVAKIVGPAVAGLLAATIGLGWCFILNAGSSLAVLAALRMMDASSIRRPLSSPKRRGQIREGFDYIEANDHVCLPLILLGITGIFAFNWNVLLPILVTQDLGRSEAMFGVVMGVMSVGSLVGTLWVARRPVVGPGFLAVAAVVAGVVMLGLAVVPGIVGVSVMLFLVGGATMVLFQGGLVSLQLGAEPAMRGRVMAVVSMALLGGYAFGGPVAGWLSDVYGPRVGIAVGGVVCVVLGVFAMVRWQQLTSRAIAAAAMPSILGAREHETGTSLSG